MITRVDTTARHHGYGADHATIRRIDSKSGLNWNYLQELWLARNLIGMLVWRDVRVRYRQTVLGLGWVVAQPLLTVLVYSILFTYVVRMPSEGLPYPIFLLTALLPWQFISRLVGEGSQSVSINANLVGKIYFPRLALPIAVAGSTLVDLVAGLVVTLFAMALFGFFPGFKILALPLVIAFSALTAFCAAVWLAPLDVVYRDIRMLIPLGLQMVMFVSPILYPSEVVPERFRWIFEANPVAIVAQSARWSLLGHGQLPNMWSTVFTFVFVIALTVAGLVVFVRTEPRFADRV